VKSLFNTRYGGPEVLEVRSLPDPSPEPTQVRIRVARAGLNFADVSARVGLYPDAPKPPMVLGYEVSGTVDAVGKDVQEPRVGARVLALTHFGGQSDCVCVPASFALPLPDAMTFDQAAALPVNYLTAHHMLFFVGRVRPKDKVLLHMAAGGVGIAAIQLLRQVEGVEIFGTASAGKHGLLREAGVTHPIDYREVDYAEEVMRLTSGRGVQLVLDPLGGPDWKKGYELLAPAGQLIAYGWANMISGESRNLPRVASQYVRMPRFSPLQLMGDNKTVTGVNVGHLWSALHILLPQANELITLFKAGKISPHVDKVFPLSQAGAAHRYMQERRNVGKVLFDCTA
jgi:NADPH:quinone reductase-like Zn-dependent oxidoreductase